jgi:tetratricopeptide (TPR) repeat protein
MVPATASRDSRRFWLLAASLAAITLLAYLPALRAGFVWDDDSFLTLNPLIRAPDGLHRFWFTTQAADYWPVTSSTLWLEWRLWGMNPAGYHATNVALHLVEVVMLWAILRRLGLPGAYLAALLFAVHPVNVESVTWIAQRKNLIAMFFYLASIACFLRTRWGAPDSGPPARASGVADPVWYGLSLGAFILAMLSKGSVAPLPLVLLGLIAWRRRLTLRDAARSAPFFAVAAGLAVVNVWFQTHGSAVIIRSATAAQRILGAGAVVWFYLGKALWPANLIFVYPQWRIAPGDWRWWLPGMAFSRSSSAARDGRPRFFRAAFFAWAYFCVMLIPVMGFADIAFMEYSLVANHYQHLAIIGVAGLAAAGWSRWRDRQARAAMAAAVGVVAILGALTWRENRSYRDLETLYRTTLAKNPDSWVAEGNLGSLLAGSGRLPEAIPHFIAALRLKPDYPQARVSLGSALARAGRLPEALGQFAEAVRLRPDFAEARYNYGLALNALGRRGEALGQFGEAVRFKPDNALAQFQFGLALAGAGRLPEAADHLAEAVRLQPDFAEAQNDLGVALAQTGRADEAAVHFAEALRLKPDYAQARANLAAIRRAAGAGP